MEKASAEVLKAFRCPKRFERLLLGPREAAGARCEGPERGGRGQGRAAATHPGQRALAYGIGI